ncbi:MAG: ATP-binding protein, partial [Gammaproteobacteria bacterium]
YQILAITLIPVFLIDLFFTYTHISSSIEQENELLQSKSQIIARQIAGASEYNLYSGNDRQIQYLLEQTVGSDDIVLAAVYDRAGKLVAESVDDSFDRNKTTDYLYHRQPILAQSIEQADVFNPDVSEGRQTDTLGWVHLYVSRQQLENNARRIINDSIVFFVSILITAFLLTVAISRRITKPIFALIEHLKYVETGQLGRVIEPTEANEIGAVQKGFNRMTRSLLTNRKHLNQRIQQATQQLNVAITDLESKNRELGFARDEAQNANRTKSEFLANMSHEIRTPINGIKGFISLLSQSRLDRTQQRYVEIIEKSTEDLTNIVNEILDFSKMESGKLHILEEEFDLYEVIEQTRDLLFITVLTKNIDLNLIIFSDTPRRVIGDKLRLKQILLNLIGNAIKFTDRGRVVIRVILAERHEDKADIEIAVEDTGIGISPEDQQYLFQAFSQVESSSTRRFVGTGLGLVISKNLASLMGGDIDMQSRPGEGSRFELRMPFKLPPGDEADSDASVPAKALVFAADRTCLMETHSLYERAGVIVESVEIDNRAGIDPVIDTIRRNRPFIDLLVFDLRHLALELEQLLQPEVISDIRTIVMDYDRGLDTEPGLQAVEFASIISTSQAIADLVARRQVPKAPVARLAGNQDRAPKRVLLVDDNHVNLTLAGELIRLWGHEVTEAENGEEALEIFQREPFDLVILDIQMPDIDGISLLGMMRERKPDNPVPIVALTANVLNDEADRLLELGFDYFLSKPIDEDSFRELLDGDPRRGAGEASATPTEKADRDCSVDYEKSLELCAGNESLLKQIFEIIQRDIPEHRQQLVDASNKRQRERLAAIAHKLYGVTCYASLPRLKRRVVDFQRRLDGNDEAPPKTATRELLDELEAVGETIDRQLEEM